MAVSLAFVARRLWLLDWNTLQQQLSWALLGVSAAACLLFALADQALAAGWAAIADPARRVAPREMARIYGLGVLMKYLPGSIFQFVSRQVGGSRAGLAHGVLARSAIVEVGLHLCSSIVVASVCLGLDRWPLLGTLALAIFPMALLACRRAMMTALAFQLVAFIGFALAAGLIGSITLSDGMAAGRFAALFLFAWLAGFVTPVAPGGLGVREAVLLSLVGSGPEAAAFVAAALFLRVASIVGDLVYGLATVTRWCAVGGAVRNL